MHLTKKRPKRSFEMRPPNPFIESITTVLPRQYLGEIVNISISNIVGSVIFENNYSINAGSQAISLSLQGFAAGTYFLKITAPEKRSITKKITKIDY